MRYLHLLGQRCRGKDQEVVLLLKLGIKERVGGPARTRLQASYFFKQHSLLRQCFQDFWI